MDVIDRSRHRARIPSAREDVEDVEDARVAAERDDDGGGVDCGDDTAHECIDC